MKNAKILEFDLKGKMLAQAEDGKTCEVDKLGIIPEDKLIIEISRRKKVFVKEVVEKSPFRTKPLCKYFGECGGCKIQNLVYEKQLFYKWKAIRKLLDEKGFAEIELEAVVPSDEQFFYRNKMEFSFSQDKWYTKKPENKIENDFALGLHTSFNKVIDVEECFLQSETSAKIVNLVRNFALEKKLVPFHFTKHTGLLQFLVIKEAKATNQMLVNLVTSPCESEIFVELAERVFENFPETTGFLHSVNETLSSTANLSRTTVLKGKDTIFEKLGDYFFKVSAASFFQVNTKQTEKLYSKIIEFGDFTGKENVLDLYCGTGSIGIFISGFVKRVFGIEIVSEAISDANGNAKLNGITNCEFVAGDVKDELGEELLKSADVLVLDPPRVGIHPKVLEKILKVKPEKIIYVSCNPGAFVSDLEKLGKIYKVERLLPFDLFPQTPHCELLAKLVRN